MKTFEEYVVDFFEEYIDKRKEKEEDTLIELLNEIRGEDDDDCLDEYVDEDGSVYGYLCNMTAEEIYPVLFDNMEDAPSRETFITDVIQDCVSKLYKSYKYSFIDEFTDDMIYHIIDCDNPIEFFKDLAYGGCQSGTIGMLIYNSDCLKIYGEHGNDLEEFREEIEGEMGCSLSSKDSSVRHYVWICWLCYEELAHEIGRVLFPDEL